MSKEKTLATTREDAGKLSALQEIEEYNNNDPAKDSEISDNNTLSDTNVEPTHKGANGDIWIFGSTKKVK